MTNTPKRSKFAVQLKAARNAERITQVDLAARHGVNFITISRYERDASPVGIPWLAPILSDYAGEPAPRTWEELEAAVAAANPPDADSGRRSRPLTAKDREARAKAERLADRDSRDEEPPTAGTGT